MTKLFEALLENIANSSLD